MSSYWDPMASNFTYQGQSKPSEITNIIFFLKNLKWFSITLSFLNMTHKAWHDRSLYHVLSSHFTHPGLCLVLKPCGTCMCLPKHGHALHLQAFLPAVYFPATLSPYYSVLFIWPSPSQALGHQMEFLSHGNPSLTASGFPPRLLP